MASDVNEPLVSIIVPIYNVGSFVLPCVNSLLAQTYSNIEFIIVDDGCTDNSIDIVEGIIGADVRFTILHKKNGGLSSARNFGTQRCHGDYLMYVDGDDLIDPRTVELMVEAADNYRVPLVVGSFAKTPLLDSYEMGQDAEFVVESGAERLRKLLLFSGESGSACGKLFERSLISSLVFPEGQLFEDMGVIASICSNTSRVAVSEAPFYAYVTRPGSITTFKKQGPKHVKDMNAAIETVRQVVGCDFQGEFECFQTYCTLRVAMKIDPAAFDDKGEAQAYLRHAQKLAKNVSKSLFASLKWRIRCSLFSFSPKVHNVFYSIYAAISGKAVG